jgi:hypothetical protein
VQNIDPPELRHGGIHRRLSRFLLCEITAERDRLRPASPNPVSDAGSLRLVYIDDCDSGALTGQFVCRSRTNPAPASSDYRDLSGQSGHRILPKCQGGNHFSVTHKKDSLT